MTVIGTIRDKRRAFLLVLDETVPFGFWRWVNRGRKGMYLHASSSSWGAHAANDLASSKRPAGVP